MAKFPGANWKPLPENSTQPGIKPTQLIYHTAVDAPGFTNLWNYFNSPGIGLESHFFVHLDGTCDQYIDTEVMADANYKANIRAISVETEDDGNINLAWTPEQMATLRSIAVWANQTHGIPLQACPSWDAPGIGYHCMWGFKDNRNLVGILDNPWTPSRGKVCPGKVRIAQFWDELLPSLQNNVILINDKRPLDMTPAQAAAVLRIQKALNTWGANIKEDSDPGEATASALEKVLAYASWKMGRDAQKKQAAIDALNAPD